MYVCQTTEVAVWIGTIPFFCFFNKKTIRLRKATFGHSLLNHQLRERFFAQPKHAATTQPTCLNATISWEDEDQLESTCTISVFEALYGHKLDYSVRRPSGAFYPAALFWTCPCWASPCCGWASRTELCSADSALCAARRAGFDKRNHRLRRPSPKRSCWNRLRARNALALGLILLQINPCMVIWKSFHYESLRECPKKLPVSEKCSKQN